MEKKRYPTELCMKVKIQFPSPSFGDDGVKDDTTFSVIVPLVGELGSFE